MKNKITKQVFKLIDPEMVTKEKELEIFSRILSVWTLTSLGIMLVCILIMDHFNHHSLQAVLGMVGFSCLISYGIFAAGTAWYKPSEFKQIQNWRRHQYKMMKMREDSFRQAYNLIIKHGNCNELQRQWPFLVLKRYYIDLLVEEEKELKKHFPRITIGLPILR